MQNTQPFGLQYTATLLSIFLCLDGEFQKGAPQVPLHELCAHHRQAGILSLE